VVQRRTLDDLDEAAVPAAGPVDESAGVPTVGEDQLHTPEACTQLMDQQHSPIAILNVGRVHDEGHDQAERIDDQVTLAPQYFLARIVPPRPPFSAVLTDWLSRIPTLGVGFLPALRRTSLRRRS